MRLARAPLEAFRPAAHARVGNDIVEGHRCARATLFAAACSVLLAPPVLARQVQWSWNDGETTLKLGVLAQPAAESADVPGTDDEANNLFLRRLRLIGGLNIGDRLALFGETDSPNLGKAANDGTKDAGDIFVQD